MSPRFTPHARPHTRPTDVHPTLLIAVTLASCRAFAPSWLGLCVVCLLAGACSRADQADVDDAEQRVELTAGERELFYGPVPGEGIDPDEHARRLLDQLTSGVAHKEFRQIIRSLVNLGEDAIPVLGARLDEILDDPNAPQSTAYTADNICDVFGQLDSPAAEAYLIRALDHPVAFVRTKAIQGLAQFATGASVAAVKPLLKSDNDQMREYALRILLAVGTDEARAAVRETIRELPSIQMTDSMERLAELGDRGVLALAEELIESDGPLIRLAAAKALLDLGREDALAQIESALRHDRPDVQARAAELLAGRSEAEAVRLLEQIYEDKLFPGVRRLVVYGLRQSGAGNWDFFMRVREGADSMLRIEANRALAGLDAAAALDVLRNDLKSDDPDLRRDAIRSLRHVDLPEAVDVLMETYDNAASPAEAKYVLTGLHKRLDPVAVPLFLRVMREDLRQVDSDRTLADVAADQASIFLGALIDPLVAAYPEGDRDARARYIATLGRTNHRRSLPALGDLFQSEPDPSLRLAMKEAAKNLRLNAAFFHRGD